MPAATTRLNKLRHYILKGEELPLKMLETYTKLREINGLLCSGYSKEQVVRIFKDTNCVSTQYCYRLIRDCMELFGDINKQSKDGLRYVQTERYTEIYQKAKEAGDYHAANNALQRIDAINDLVSRRGDTVKEALPLPTIINFVGDPKVLITNSIENGGISE